MKKYLAIDQTLTGSGIADEENRVFDTASEANETARAWWDHLTAAEKKERHIFAAAVYDSTLSPDAIDEDGVIDWGAWESCDAFDGAFDSDEA